MLTPEQEPAADKPPVPGVAAAVTPVIAVTPGAAAPVTTPAALKAVMAGTSRKKKSAF